MWFLLYLFIGPELVTYTVSHKRVDFVTVARNILSIDFDDIWHKYSKDSENSVCMFQFVCAFCQLFVFQTVNCRTYSSFR